MTKITRPPTFALLYFTLLAPTTQLLGFLYLVINHFLLKIFTFYFYFLEKILGFKQSYWHLNEKNKGHTLFKS